MTKGEYIEQVLLRMNEASQEGVTAVIGSDRTQADTFIQNTFTESWRKCVNLLPIHILPQSDFQSDDVTPNLEKGIGVIRVPADFEKFVVLKMQGWRTEVRNAYSPDNDIMLLQDNEFTRGNIHRPVVILDTENSNTVLRYYSLPKFEDRHVIEYGRYIKKLSLPISNTDTFVVNSKDKKYLEPLIWIHAGMVLDVFGKTDNVKICEKNALLATYK